MSIVVQKYGGSSVASPEKLKQVARRVMATQAAGHDVAVVVSAMGGHTDELLALAQSVSAAPDRRELDMLLTAGERVSMTLLTMAIRELDGEAISFTGSQAGILTNDRHIDARIVEVRPYRVQDELARGKIVIVAGYQGVSYRKEITTLGRGGSDTTAVALAAALDAEWCEICSDVDGVYTADPRIVTDARRIAELSFEETQEMAEAGAKVLNAQAVEFAKEKGIAIYARATASPPPAEGMPGDGTIIRKDAPPPPGNVSGIASEKHLLRLRVPGAAPDEVLAFLDQHQVSGKQLHLTPGESCALSLVLSSENLHGIDAFQTALDASFGDGVELTRNWGAVSVVGSGINVSCANLLRGNAALDEAKIPFVDVTTSSFRITWMMKEANVPAATRILHAVFGLGGAT